MVALAFYKFAVTHFVGADGKGTGEANNYRAVIRPLRRMFGASAAADFKPTDLKSFRRSMLLPREVEDEKNPGKLVTVEGWSRNYANRQARRVTAIFKWAASESMVNRSVGDALETVQDIREGREGARETTAVGSVSADVVEATLPFMPPPVAALVKVQLLTVARGGELFRLTTASIDRSALPWTYTPKKHKTAHKNKVRTIRFGPKAREVITPFLNLAEPHEFLFRPADAVAWRNQKQREKREQGKNSHITPSQKRRAEQSAKRPKKFRPHYNKTSYRLAVTRACAKAEVPHWHPHQLRHTSSTVYRREADRETSKILAGHYTEAMVERYAERDDSKANAAVEAFG